MNDVAEVLPIREYPRCSVCKMPVIGFFMEIVGNKVYFIACCHGQVDLTSFTLEEFEGLTEVEFGDAFTPQTRPLIGSQSYRR